MATTPLPSSGPPSASRYRFVPILLTIVCGVVLAASSCFGFLSTLNGNRPHNWMAVVFFFGFVIGVGVVAVGAVSAVIGIVIWFIRATGDGT